MNPETVLPDAKRWMDDHRDEMVAALQEQLRIPSKEGEPQPGAPFGIECGRALDTALALADKAGFRTKNLDGYAGHAEFGDGEDVVMALGHLDVVPEGDGWKHDPYGATIEDGYIYARGAGDDKGPAYAAFFAARAVKEMGLPLKRRVRVVFGCNEESGFRCLKHYFAHEAPPAYGFAPDAEWPLVFAEKGIANMTLAREMPAADGLHVVSAKGGERPNIVPQSAQAVLAGPAEEMDRAREVLRGYWDKNVGWSASGETITVTAAGKPAHGAMPFQGDNAIVRLFRVLRDLPLIADADWIDVAFQMGHPSGVGLGLHGRDDVVGDLTANLGILKLENGKLEMLFNLRYPVEWNGDMILAKNAKVREKHGFEVASFGDSPPLHVPVTEDPVSTILKVVAEEFGEELEPQTMGGGTYARAVPKTVAVGTGWPGDGPPHEANERYAVSSYLRAAAIYADIFYRLATLP